MDMTDSSIINNIVSIIVLNHNPDKIILFESYATGFPHNNGDIDLIIIKDIELPMHFRIFEIYKSLFGLQVPEDIIVYTNRGFEQEKNQENSFIHSAIKTSRI